MERYLIVAALIVVAWAGGRFLARRPMSRGQVFAGGVVIVSTLSWVARMATAGAEGPWTRVRFFVSVAVAATILTAFLMKLMQRREAR